VVVLDVTASLRLFHGIRALRQRVRDVVASLLDWLDQAAGVAPAAYDWLEMPPSFNTRVELMDRVEHAEALLFVARRLILQLTGWLTAKQLDA